MRRIPPLLEPSSPFIGAVVTLAPATAREEQSSCIVPMSLIIIRLIPPYRVSQDLGLVPVSLAQDVILAIYQDLGNRIDKQKKERLV